MSTDRIMHQAFLFTRSQKRYSKAPYEKAVTRLLKDNPNTDFLEPLDFYLAFLDTTDPVRIAYMSVAQKQEVRRKLQVTYLLLLAEKRYEEEHQKTEHLEHYETQLERCQELLDLIHYQQRCVVQQVQPAPDYGHTSPKNPVAYCGIFLGQYFAAQIMEMSQRQTKTVKKNLDWVNGKRLYWVWSSSLLKNMLLLLPQDFFYADQAKKMACLPDPYTGSMSWGLYYFRFALNLSLLLKHTLSGPWMSSAEKELPWTARFKTQWAQRKFTLLNDVVWATGNLLCFLWLTGQGAAGTWGDLLTLVLLLFDISLAAWEYAEKKTAYDKAMFDYQNTIDKLHADIKACREKKEKNDQQLMELMTELSAIEQAKKQCEREWRYQNITLMINLTYAIGLMMAFAVMTVPFLPIAAVTVASMTVVGAVLCFALSVIVNAIKGGIEIHKSKCSERELKALYTEQVLYFKKQHHTLDDNAKKLLFLDIKKLFIDSKYQEGMVTLQQATLLRAMIVESLVPPLVFLSLVFFPLGAGLGILAAAIALAVTSHLLINTILTPQKHELGEFNEAEYASFAAEPDAWDKKMRASFGFFQSSPTTANSDNPYLDDGNIVQQSV